MYVEILNKSLEGTQQAQSVVVVSRMAKKSLKMGLAYQGQRDFSFTYVKFLWFPSFYLKDSIVVFYFHNFLTGVIFFKKEANV